MRIGELASALGVSRDAIMGWMDNPELNHFFSDGALLKAGGSQRVFTENDVLILNTIRHMRNAEKIRDWSLIAQRIEAGQLEQDFPQNAITTDNRTIPLPQAEQSARAAATLAERDAALARVKELEQALANEQAGRRSDMERFLRELAELRYTIGRLEAERGKGE